jgi:hypothetical protein
MRIPFFNRKPEDLRKLSARATHIGSAEAAMPRLSNPRTAEEYRAAGERMRRRRANGAPPS